MKKLRFKGLPGTALSTEYDNGKVRFRVGTIKELSDEDADALLADFPLAFEVLEDKPEPEPEPIERDTKPEHDRMRRSAPHKRGKGK